MLLENAKILVGDDSILQKTAKGCADFFRC